MRQRLRLLRAVKPQNQYQHMHASGERASTAFAPTIPAQDASTDAKSKRSPANRIAGPRDTLFAVGEDRVYKFYLLLCRQGLSHLLLLHPRNSAAAMMKTISIAMTTPREIIARRRRKKRKTKRNKCAYESWSWNKVLTNLVFKRKARGSQYLPLSVTTTHDEITLCYCLIQR